MGQTKGFQAEQEAKKYLESQGLSFIRSNYYCRLGEIDLIMRDKTILVFVEVRARTSLRYGSAIESVTRKKQEKILKTASFYMMTQELLDSPCRFDVLGLQGHHPLTMIWIRNAFML